MKLLATSMICVMTNLAWADATVNMNMTAASGIGESAGTVTITETPYGLLFNLNVKGIKEGVRGFHVHEKSDCGDNGMAAGGHLDPKKTQKHLGPFNAAGHLGDLPALYANADGTVPLPVLAPKLKHISDIKGHALMIHSGGDNYSDTPQPLGGGNGRMVCGVIK